MLLKQLAIQNRDNVTRNVEVSLAQPAGAFLDLVRQDLTTLQLLAEQPWVVLEEGDSLIAIADGPNVHFWSSGALLPK